MLKKYIHGACDIKKIVTCRAHHHLIDNSKVKYCTVESCIFHKIGTLFKIRMNYLKNNFLADSRENHMETLKEYMMKRYLLYCDGQWREAC